MSYEKDDEKMSELLQKYGDVQQKYIQKKTKKSILFQYD